MEDGATGARLSHGAIATSLKPFIVRAGSTLTLDDVKATTPVKIADGEFSMAEVHGTLVATRLDYDAQSHEGISVKTGGELTVTDSVIHGTGALDLISSYGGKKLSVSYSTLSGGHCGFHFEPAEAFTIDHVTSESNTYGMTIYGSGAGPNTVTASNIAGNAAWLDFQGNQHGAITFDGVFTSGGEVMTGGPVPPNVKNKAAERLTDAKPR